MTNTIKNHKIKFEKTIETYIKNLFSSIIFCVKHYDISSRILQRHVRKKQQNKKDEKSNKIKLIQTQKQILKVYIEFLNKLKFSAKLFLIRNATNYLLKHSGSTSRVRKN